MSLIFIKLMLNSVGFLHKYCSASQFSCLACDISVNLVMRDNQQAIDLLFTCGYAQVLVRICMQIDTHL